MLGWELRLLLLLHGAQRDTLLPPGFLLPALGVEAVVIARCDTLLPPGFLPTLGVEAVINYYTVLDLTYVAATLRWRRRPV